MYYETTNPSNNYSGDSARKLPRAEDLKMYVERDGSFQRANCAASRRRKQFEDINGIFKTVELAGNIERGKCMANKKRIEKPAVLLWKRYQALNLE